MKRIVFLTPADARYGFSLAGVTQLTLEPEEVDRALGEMVQQPETGVVVIDERLVPAIPEKKLQEIEKRWPGLVIVLPAPEKPEIEIEDYALRLVRRAIGYQVRLNL
ncbi:hypothetical protein DESUT3_17970 [Desulfuromonas versatilis]|uniref:ATPase n=1 Tax=Desulfuromonas versatilis TaxID=2802975 RepID=A0ABM8HVZ1_9BACT|nr:V-type ATP synthase subunit F [Desulfuromonas versatilis]BCR04728.1 hypothetical protein DESUT3_17970 [Desulfuromonas versatilis]